MGFLRKVSDSDIQEVVDLFHPEGCMTNGSTVNAAVTNSGGQTKRKREPFQSSSSTSVATAYHAISDDSDASSDEDKPTQELPPGCLYHRQTLGIKRRRKHHKHRRGVVFGDLESSTRYHAATLSKEDVRELKKDLWFTKQDRLQTQAECLEVLKSFRIQNAKEVTQFSDVYRTSMQVPFSKESSDYLEQATISVPLQIRGMEWGIAPKLKKRRKEHIQSILTLHKQISNIELRERFVSSRSLQSSRPARIIARMVGEGDASASKLGITSTALNVTTVPMKTKKIGATKKLTGEANRTVRQKEQNENSLLKKATSNGVIANAITRSTRMGQPRRRRRQILSRK